jgi:hypothetical protein
LCGFAKQDRGFDQICGNAIATSSRQGLTCEKRYITVLIFALAAPSGRASPSWAAENNGGGPSENKCPTGSNPAGYKAAAIISRTAKTLGLRLRPTK